MGTVVPLVGLLGNLAACTLAAWLWRRGRPVWVAPGGAQYAMANAWPGPRCWSAWCTVRGCDGVHHVDPHGRTWVQPEGWVWNPDTRTYQPPRER
jgi:hypothetical protein